ncbi:hypothetical protein COCCADRAFT_111839, partial [Bipolaris zeicola 26-R-13]
PNVLLIFVFLLVSISSRTISYSPRLDVMGLEHNGLHRLYWGRDVTCEYF